ncbi:MAG: hypothetical protein V3U80_06640 [Flavobacteriaceae bacterium]
MKKTLHQQINVLKKIVITSLLIGTVLTTKAQITTEIIHSKSIDSVLIDVSKATLNSNVLYNRVHSFAKLKTFNDSVNVSNKNHFEQALSELHRASKMQKFQTVDAIRNNYSFEKSTVEIGIINTNFHSINYNGKNEQLGGLVYDETAKKMAAITSKQPFIETQTLVIAPLKKYAIGSTINFKFSNTLLFDENTHKNIQSMDVDFDNGQTHTIITNGSIVQNSVPVNYTINGIKTLTFNITFTDGSVGYTFGEV